MLILQGITYTHPNRDLLFDNLSFTINQQDKIALIGNNGTGKSTLLKIIAGDIFPAKGAVKTNSKPYYVPQIFGQYNDVTVAQALQIEDKLHALKEILDGNMTEKNIAVLNDDWTIEERCAEALTHWDLKDIDLQLKMESLSGGQKTKVFLAGIIIHQPSIVLLDEPSNHLDGAARAILHDYIQSTTDTLVVVSHDRALLNLLDIVYELSEKGITAYGGNYEFYVEQKLIEENAFEQDLKSKEKALRKAKETEREAMERKQKLDARGRKKQEKAGLPTISMNTFRNRAEKSTAQMKDVHAEKIGSLSDAVDKMRKQLPDIDKIRIGLNNSSLHKGKILINARNINYKYNDELLWKNNLNFLITSGKRIAIKGFNSSGKTTLIKIILGKFEPSTGAIDRAANKTIYIDQDYSLIDNGLTVYEQAQKYNYDHLQEHEVKNRLNRFLFTRPYWDKSCGSLSGGEKMRLMLCCLTMSDEAPDIIVLDEPTNNLDIQNIEILTRAINEYKGTLIVVSHDEYFLQQIGAEEELIVG
ncbi:ribosomal protection-like ABC-F family protein [Pinibacter soli]|uniref:ABC-F family ATP-binding cassette domain-containing protein n=1 Tax=Pinibacter soli TaxID=3044211 RepID=A0ABT6R6X3_9BACT|nr:ABC-F family ATP-binding cassette domain-containing protein [Pinibacter soli]MDI3318311.1 ABC-F family ATP-binding cassette domain-containing protein [Pinibacter soli]